jgi:hydroxyacylglutathione hydrolase
MLIERSMHPSWLSNSYLVADRVGGSGVIIDSGGPSQKILSAAQEHDLTVKHLLLTHHHHDHVAETHVYQKRLGVEVFAHPREAELLQDVDATLEPNQLLSVGDLTIEPLHTPGHTAGMLSFRVNTDDVFTGDTLFKNSVGGVRAPGSTSFSDIKSSIMEVLMSLPAHTRLHPGHTDPTTVGDEWNNNPFVRIWRGLDAEATDRCRVGDEPATLVLFGPDYDGGHKAWVRWDDSGRDDIVPGSLVVT